MTPSDSATDGPDTGDEESRRTRRALWRLPTGLYVLGSRAGSRRNLMTASWVTQVATDPRRVGVGVERASLSLALVAEGGVFALSLPARDDRAVVRRFVRPVAEDDVAVDASGTGTMRGVAVRTRVTGAPVLAAAAVWIDCAVAQLVDLGSHSWVVGDVLGAGFGEGGEDVPVLTMGDTRMNYGG